MSNVPTSTPKDDQSPAKLTEAQVEQELEEILGADDDSDALESGDESEAQAEDVPGAGEEDYEEEAMD